eukprot:CAMPEP_0195517356 /NCGR_PEP_ID=MMETSP0794_2-20130614/10540_1 /TAXON_ID=515487 /ORGANISM="Stephanopyxis turris, Strain CCMP 815" /LENGTH=165 /DNA_ID=CAMNT_0040646147 /DNA_START=58 /DNA_END=555 /DNA_ORIENTATION=+
MAGTSAEKSAAAKAKLAARFGRSTRTGGAGSVRRKKKAVHKTTSNDDKRLQSVMKKLQSNVIPAVEEANLFLEDGNVVHIERPKVQASIGANTYVISGKSETKPLNALLPGILTQLGTDNLDWEALSAAMRKEGVPGVPAADAGDDSDDDVPDLVENFEDASEAN